MNVERIRQFFTEYCDTQYELGYQEGLAGKEYSGRTFIGYHGWWRGRQEREVSHGSTKV